MRKLVPLSIALILFSCSTEEDGNRSDDPIIGVWEAYITYSYQTPSFDGSIGENIVAKLTITTEMIRQEINYYNLYTTTSTSSGTASAPEVISNGECKSIDKGEYLELIYEVEEYTWKNLGVDIKSQKQTYELFEYSDCGEPIIYENEKDKEENTFLSVLNYNLDFSEFYIDYDDELIFSKVVD